MCPEHTLLSTYVDNEVDAPTARGVEAHVAECGACRRRLRAYQRVCNALLESREPDVLAAGARVWRRLDLARQAVRRRASFWTRGVRVPAPAAAAALLGAALLITSVALWARINDSRGAAADHAAAAAGAARAAQGAIVIRLPEEPQFLQLGQPAILREAELAQEAHVAEPP